MKAEQSGDFRRSREVPPWALREGTHDEAWKLPSCSGQRPFLQAGDNSA